MEPENPAEELERTKRELEAYKASVKEMLAGIRQVLQAGPPDRAKSQMRVFLTELMHEKDPAALKGIAAKLRPILKDVALGFLEAGNIKACRMAISVMNLHNVELRNTKEVADGNRFVR